MPKITPRAIKENCIGHNDRDGRGLYSVSPCTVIREGHGAGGTRQLRRSNLADECAPRQAVPTT